jgi:hypothetical protein
LLLFLATSAHADPVTPNLGLNPSIVDEIAQRDAEAGQVDPAWHKLARDVENAFRPDPRIVSQTDSATLWARQMAKFMGKNGIVSSPQLENRAAPVIADAMRFERAFEDEPAAWERVVIEVEIDERGVMRRTEIVEHSDKASLERAALDAMALALTALPLPPARIRFAIETAIVVQPPTPSISMNGRRRGAFAATKFKFDEVSGKVEPRPWFLRRLLKRVSVLSSSPE